MGALDAVLLVMAALAVIASGAAFVLARSEPTDLVKLRDSFDRERAALRRDFAEALEQAAEIATTVERHRRKIDAAKAQDERTKGKRAAQGELLEESGAGEPSSPLEDDLSAIRRRARARGMM